MKGFWGDEPPRGGNAPGGVEKMYPYALEYALRRENKTQLKRPIIAREGWPYLLVLGLLAAILIFVNPWLALVPAVLFGFVGFFFRDPERPIPSGEEKVVSPADGRIMYVREVQEDRFIKDRAVLVSIFLSVFDVHINRAPVGGTVAYQQYVPGKFVAAWADKVEEINERNYIGLDTPRGRVLVAQIAGLIARRIVWWVKPGDSLARGERFGLIKFGSCTQVYLPLGTEILVKAGERVKGGETVIGRFAR